MMLIKNFPKVPFSGAIKSELVDWPARFAVVCRKPIDAR